MGAVSWLNFILAIITPPTSSAACHLIFRRWLTWYISQGAVMSGWITSSAWGITYALITHQWPWFTGSLISLIIALMWWWWRRKNRKRAAKLAGAKARARLAAMLRKARETTQPRPVLKPVPGPA